MVDPAELPSAGSDDQSGGPPDADVVALRALTANLLADLDGRVDGYVGRLREHMPEYASVPSADARTSTTAIIRSVLEYMSIHSVAPDARRIEALEELARRRVGQGFPLEALTRSIQLTARFVLEDLDQEAARCGTQLRVVLHSHDLAWAFSNDAAGHIAGIAHAAAVDDASRKAEHRVAFVRAVVFGEYSAARISAEADTVGLNPAALYHPMRARAFDPADLAALSAVVMRTSATSDCRPVLAVIDGDLIGLLPQRPAADDRWLVALADAGFLPDLAPLFAQTLITLEVGLAFDRTGVVTVSDLGPLPLAMLGSETADALHRRHLGALDDGQPGRQDVEETVWTYLDNDRNLDRTAAHLHVHRNTVRYRLIRFEEMTHLNLRRTHDLVLVWWLLASRHARRR